MTTKRTSDRTRIVLGVAITNTILLVYALFRPDSVEFSLAFLIAPSLALLWTVAPSPIPSERRAVLWVTWGSVIGAVTVVAINWLRR